MTTTKSGAVTGESNASRMEALKTSIANKTALARMLDSLHTNLCAARTQTHGMTAVCDLITEARDRIALAAKWNAEATMREWKRVDAIKQ